MLYTTFNIVERKPNARRRLSGKLDDYQNHPQSKKVVRHATVKRANSVSSTQHMKNQNEPIYPPNEGSTAKTM